MSADNGIYILQAKDGFRVIEAQAIENLSYWEFDRCSDLNPQQIKQYFGNAKVIQNAEDAMKIAKEMYNEIINSDFPTLEYGICTIPGWEDKPFPD